MKISKAINEYKKIIKFARNENRVKNYDNINTKDYEYYESHHIIPRSLGGKNHSENKVLLKMEEHLKCHLLLCHINKNNKPRFFKMLTAMNYFFNSANNNIRQSLKEKSIEKILNEFESLFNKYAKEIAKTKKEYSILLGKNNKGKNNPMYGRSAVSGRIWLNNSKENKYIFKTDTEEIDKLLNEGYQYGRCKLNSKKTMMINNGKNYKLIIPDDFDKYSKLGWKKGHTEKYKMNVSDRIKKDPLCWIYSDDLNDVIYVKTSLIEEYLNKGYKKGRPRRYWSQKQK